MYVGTCCPRGELDVEGRVHLDDVCEIVHPLEGARAGPAHHLTEHVAPAGTRHAQVSSATTRQVLILLPPAFIIKIAIASSPKYACQ
jgi:hypothetical protein